MLGTGIYTPEEAARLLHERAATVRRWAFGYRRNRVRGPVAHPPLITTDLPALEGERALTFVEVVELLYVRAFQKAGVSWAAIREAASTAARIHSTAHPFALRTFYIDPKAVYANVMEQDGSESLVQLRGHGQHVFHSLVKPYLEQLEFGTDNLASRWYPMGKHGGVVIDPARAFGAPIVEEVGIRTEVLASTVAAEEPTHGDRAPDYVAWTFRIENKHVDAALRFETWLREAA